jgi:uncharacterized protein YndB with AHSA1/START domain
MASAREGMVTTHIDARPQEVWTLLANLERMGEWSPECYRVTWLDGAASPAQSGARFKGQNRWGPVRWAMTCEVKTAKEGRELSWTTVQRGKDVVTWRYELVADGEGTVVKESFRVHWLPPMARVFEDVLMVNRDRNRERAMQVTLGRIKAAVEKTV